MLHVLLVLQVIVNISLYSLKLDCQRNRANPDVHSHWGRPAGGIALGGVDAGPKTCAKKLTPSDFFNPHRLPFKHKIRWLYISAWLKEAWQCHDTYESRTIIFSL